MTKRKTDEEFKQEVYDLVGNEYTFLEPYANALTKLKIKHIECGNTYEVNPINFIHGKRCPYCSIKDKSKTDIQFQHEINFLVGNEYTFLDKYVNNHTKLRVKHNKCGNVYEVRPGDFLRGSRCPCCAGNAKKTDAQFKQEIFSLVGDEYTFLDKYVNADTKIKVKHNECGNIYEVKPANFISGNRCSYCAGNAKKTDIQFQHEIYSLVGSEYTFLDKYVNAMTKLRVKHIECGNTYEVNPINFIHGERCPFCTNTPKGETIITKLLDTLNINYEYQQTFDDLKDNRLLSYDFYVPSQNILIEYQGIQHYQPINYFGGDDTFGKQQKHDQMKLDYAKEHGYNLILVPYTEDTLPKIKKYLIKHGLK